ncbi:MAG: helix-turn-helix domain-containing protein [Candidatus Xenobia bacterium]
MRRRSPTAAAQLQLTAQAQPPSEAPAPRQAPPRQAPPRQAPPRQAPPRQAPPRQALVRHRHAAIADVSPAGPTRSASTNAPLPLLPLKEVERILGLGRTAVGEMVRSGVIPSVRLGRRRLVRPESLARVLEQLEEGNR